jgi:uncharacterized protein (DUF58 family)
MLAFPRRMLRVTVAVPDSMQVGERGAVTVTIGETAHPRSTRFWLVREQRPDPDPEERVVAEASPGAAAQARFPLWAQRRGHIHVDAAWLRWRGPLGLVELTRRIEVGRAIDVVPNVRGTRSSVLQFLSREALHGSKVQEQKGEGTEFDALRDYVTGMDSRFIDWKHSARHRRLVSKEFRSERNHQIILAFDTGYLMVEPVDGCRGSITRSMRGCCCRGSRCRAAISSACSRSTRSCGSTISRAAACRPSRGCSAPPPVSTTATPRPISRSAWPSWARGCAAARSSSCSPSSSTRSRPS